MNPIGDNVKSKSAKKDDILINSNGKGSHIGDSKSSKNSIESQRDNSCEDGDDDDLDDYSSKSDVGSNKYKEVDRFGFVGGNQYTDPTTDSSLLPIEILRMRELKWLDMMENWEKWMSKRFKKVKERCRKGIPDSLRARAWQLLTGSANMLTANPGRYHGYVNSKGNPACLDEIRKDVSRQYPHHELFMDDQGQGQEDLYSVLMAYSVHDPSVGYCQAQGPLAAVLLTLMPAEQAFWTFLTICEKYLPGYYNMGLEAVQIDSMILFGLLKKSCPIAYKHLKKQKVEPILWMTDWFMCLYSRTLPWPSVLRVWDMFLCEGVKVMFRVALVLVKSVLGTSEQLSKCPTFYETLDKLRKIPAEYMEENYLAGELAKLQLTDKDMEKEHSRQLKKWNASKAEKVQKNNSNSMISVATTSTPCVDASSASKTSNSCAVLTSPSTISNSTLATSSASILAPSALSTTSESSNPNRPTDSQVVQTAKNPSESSPILPPPGYLLLPNAISSSPSLKPLISLPESVKTTKAVPLPAVGTAVTSPAVATTTAFVRPNIQTSADDGQSKAQKDNRFSKRFPFLSTRTKTKSLSNAPQEYLQPSAAGSKESVIEPIAIHEPFKRYQSKPSVSPCSSLSAVPQLPDKKRRTFRMSFYRPKASKSTTHIDQ